MNHSATTCAVTRYLIDDSEAIRKGSTLTPAEESAAWERLGHDQPPCPTCAQVCGSCACWPDEEGRFRHKDVNVARRYLANLRKIHGR